MADMKKGVRACHPEYEATVVQWQRCRDVFEGQDAVKRRTTAYLPKLTGQRDGEYSSYLLRACFFNATERTVRGLAGSILRKEPELDGASSSDEERLARIGPYGESFIQTTKKTLEETLAIGRVGLFVDAPSADDAKVANPPPYISTIMAESIINWRSATVEGVEKLVLVVIAETYEGGNDEFERKSQTQYRVLRLDTTGLKPQYTVQLYRKNMTGQDTSNEFIPVGPPTVPTMWGGRPLDFIPFVFVGPDGVDPCVKKSPILDLADMNLSHYRTSADLEHGQHFTCLPQAWVAGFKLEGDITIGSERAWATDDPNAKAGYLEFTGAGLGRLAESLKEKRSLMAVQGARLLEEQKAVGEAAETHRIRAAGEGSILVNVARSVGDGLSMALSWLFVWETSGAADVKVVLNTDFMPAAADAAVLTTLLAALQGSALSFESWFKYLQDAEIVPEGHSVEDERAAIEAGNPAGLPAVPPIDPNAPIPPPNAPVPPSPAPKPGA